jgi:hypothetical protein
MSAYVRYWTRQAWGQPRATVQFAGMFDVIFKFTVPFR